MLILIIVCFCPILIAYHLIGIYSVKFEFKGLIVNDTTKSKAKTRKFYLEYDTGSQSVA